MTPGIYLSFALVFMFVDAMACAVKGTEFWIFYSLLMASLWPISAPLFLIAVYLKNKSGNSIHQEKA